MWSIRQLLRNKKGFTLLELLCCICIGSIVIGICLSMLTYSSKSNVSAEQTDELLYNGNFAMEYIKYEIQNADKVIATNSVQDLNSMFPNNIGLVVMEYQPKYSGIDKYVYFTYYIQNNRLYRLSKRFDAEVPISGAALTEKNELCDSIESFGDTYIDWDNKMLYLDLKICGSRLENRFKSAILLSCSLDY